MSFSSDDLQQYPVRLAELPQGWMVSDIAALATNIQPGFPSGKHNQDGQGVPHLRPMNVSRDGSIDLTDLKYVLDQDGPRLNDGDVLFNNTNSPALVGKTAVVRRPSDWAFSNHMTRITPARGVVPSYLAHHLHYLWMTGYLRHRCVNHVNQASISSGPLASVPIAVPPSAEQERIVAAIEEQFSRLDVGMAALERVRRNLKRMRAAVLRAATLGMLVPHDPSDPSAESWLMASGKPAGVGTQDGPKFLAGWAFTTIGSLKTWSLYGPRFSSDDYVVEGTPVLRTTDITDTGRILVGQAPKLALARDELEKYRVHVGDVLITRTGSIGTVAYISDEQPAIPGAYLILYRFGLPVQFSEFLFYFLQSPQVQSQLVVKSAGIGRPNLNAPSIDGIVVGVPPWAELLRIVGEVRAQLDSIDSLDNVLRAAGARVAASRSSILAAAFSGRLVPQDPDDEPASVLLERIAAERASSNGHRPTNARKPRTTRPKVPA